MVHYHQPAPAPTATVTYCPIVCFIFVQHRRIVATLAYGSAMVRSPSEEYDSPLASAIGRLTLYVKQQRLSCASYCVLHGLAHV
jgi:hypothetical protein